jgi:hypothetical protein
VAWSDRSPAERAAIDYCAPRGIALSVFCGRPVGLGDPQWTADDRAAVFEWLAEQASRCRDCGADLGECMDAVNTFEYQAEALWCHGCRAIHRAAVELSGPGTKANPVAGARYRFTRTPQTAKEN